MGDVRGYAIRPSCKDSRISLSSVGPSSRHTCSEATLWLETYSTTAIHVLHSRATSCSRYGFFELPFWYIPTPFSVPDQINTLCTSYYRTNDLPCLAGHTKREKRCRYESCMRLFFSFYV